MSVFATLRVEPAETIRFPLVVVEIVGAWVRLDNGNDAEPIAERK